MTVITRDEWEESGYRIAQHSTSPPVDLEQLGTVVIHHPGAERIWTDDPVAYFRNAQRTSVAAHDHSIAYNWGYWPDGREIELRGLDFRNAANSIDDDDGVTNRRTVSLLIVTPNGGKPTAAQEAAVRRRRQLLDELKGSPLPAIGHRDLEPTACPGDGNYASLRSGAFDPDPEEDIDMQERLTYIVTPPPQRKGGAWLFVEGGNVRYATNRDTAEGIEEWQCDSLEQYDNLVRSIGLRTNS